MFRKLTLHRSYIVSLHFILLAHAQSLNVDPFVPFSAFFTMAIRLHIICLTLLVTSCGYAAISFPRFPTIRRVLVDDMNSWVQAVLEEVRFHKSNLDQYRDRINRIVSTSIDAFKADQSSYYSKQLREFESYLKQVDDTYKDVKYTIKIQQQAINELNGKYMRSERIDESLEAFKLFYNETSSSYRTFAKNPLLVLSTMRMTDMFHRQKDTDDPWSMQIESLNKKLQQNWQLLTDEGPRSFEAVIENTLQNITRFQDDVFRQAYVVRNFSQVLLPSASTKQDLRSARVLFETQLSRFETDRRVWIEDKKRLLDSSLQTLNSKIALRDSIYGELLDKRTEAIRYTAMSDRTLSKVLQLIDANAAGWKLMKSVDGIDVYRLLKEHRSAEGSYACVKSYGVIRASPSKVVSLLADITRMKEYNSFFDRGRDVAVVGANTKIVWASSITVFPFKPRDFCTVVNVRRLKDGTTLILNTATNHPLVPQRAKYIRGSVKLGKGSDVPRMI